MADRNGNTSRYAYVSGGAAAGALSTITDPVGQVTVLNYDSSGQLSGVVDPAQAVVPAAAPTPGDAGFESPSVGSGSFQYDPTGTAWAFTGSAGVSGNGSGFTAGNPAAPEGTQVAFLQETGVVQPVGRRLGRGHLPVSFDAAQRGNYQASQQDFEVLVDGGVGGHLHPLGHVVPALRHGRVHRRRRGAHDRLPGPGHRRRRQHRLHRRRRRRGVAAAARSATRASRQPSVGTGALPATTRPARAWTFSGDAGVAATAAASPRATPPPPRGPRSPSSRRPARSASRRRLGRGQLHDHFDAAQRGNYRRLGQDFEVLVDGVVVGTFTPAGTVYQAYTTAAFTVAAGSHTITFQGLDTAGGDNTAFVDAVTIAPVRGRATDFRLDSDGNLTQIVDPDGAVTRTATPPPRTTWSPPRPTPTATRPRRTTTASASSPARRSSTGRRRPRSLRRRSQGLLAPGGSGAAADDLRRERDRPRRPHHDVTFNRMGHPTARSTPTAASTTITYDQQRLPGHRDRPAGPDDDLHLRLQRRRDLDHRATSSSSAGSGDDPDRDDRLQRQLRRPDVDHRLQRQHDHLHPRLARQRHSRRPSPAA